MILGMAAFQIFAPCLLGMFVLLKGDKYYENLCNISWHLLSLSDQKSLSLLLVTAIRPKSITMGIKVLNLQSFLEVILFGIFLIHTFLIHCFNVSPDLQGHLLVFYAVAELEVRRHQVKSNFDSKVFHRIISFIIICYLLSLNIETFTL